MRDWSAQRIADEAGAVLTTTLRSSSEIDVGPRSVVIDSRQVGPGDLFVALPGKRVDGGKYVGEALQAGVWGVLTTPTWAGKLANTDHGNGVVLAVVDPLQALAALARAWRIDIGAKVIGVTGSVGKTSTKDLIASLIRPYRKVVASHENYNTEIGVPLMILSASRGTEVLVLELAARDFGQIAELAEICLPDVGVVTRIAPVHLEQFGSLEGVAKVKGELFECLPDGATAIAPSGETRLRPYLRPNLDVVTFGLGGDVDINRGGVDDVERAAILAREKHENDVDLGIELRGDEFHEVAIVANGKHVKLELPFSQNYQLENTLAALAATHAVGVEPTGRIEVSFSSLRGERVSLPCGATVINDCYNASPFAVEAALEDFAQARPAGRRIAVLGDMMELGSREPVYHREIGHIAGKNGVDVLVTVGRRAAAMVETYIGESYITSDANEAASLLAGIVDDGDLVLVKGSRGMGLEVIAETLLDKPRGGIQSSGSRRGLRGTLRSMPQEGILSSESVGGLRGTLRGTPQKDSPPSKVIGGSRD